MPCGLVKDSVKEILSTCFEKRKNGGRLHV